jgi:TPR repeat protein
MQMPDSAVGYIRAAAAQPNANKTMIAGFTLSIGNTLYKAGVASKVIADYEKAVPVLQLADSLGAGPNAKFLLGVTAFQIGITAAQQVGDTKSCELSKKAQDNFAIAQVNVPPGGRENPEAAKAIMDALAQYSPSVDAMVKQNCKGR